MDGLLSKEEEVKAKEDELKKMLEALKKLAGAKVAERVAYKPDVRIQAIVKTWPVNFRTPHALAMGFKADVDVESIIRDYVANEGIKL